MRKILFAASALAALTLAACDRGGPSPSGPSAADTPPPAPQQTPAPEPRPTTEASAVSGGEGAYGMPRAPVPYSQLTVYEQQQLEAQGGRPAALTPPAGVYKEEQATAKNRRSQDAVFY